MLYVRFRDGAGGETTLSFKRRHWWGGELNGAYATYHCLVELELGSTLAFDASRSPIFALPTSIVATWFLSKGRDGALIVNYRTGDVWRWSESIWWRYPAFASD